MITEFGNNNSSKSLDITCITQLRKSGVKEAIGSRVTPVMPPTEGVLFGNLQDRFIHRKKPSS